MPGTATAPHTLFLRARRFTKDTLPKRSRKRQEIVQGIHEQWIRYRLRLHILLLALQGYRSLSKALKAVLQMRRFTREVYGTAEVKLVRVGRQYFFSYYTPGYPSRAFDDYIRSELNRYIPLPQKTGALTNVLFAITRRCPLQCEHCFEWDHLGQEEAFTLEGLKEVIMHYQREGVMQFHLSGGEPLVRFSDLEALLSWADKRSEFWILTSGLNLTCENARRLKEAGATGVVVSLDHFDAGAHNAFRGSVHAHGWAVDAIRNAQEAGMVVAVSVCATRSFTTPENLLHYAEYVHALGVSFIQVLEPRAVGHYKGRKVALDRQQLGVLEDFFRTLNFDARYKAYPIVLYHGYYQRRVGCLAAGNRHLYIDSEGFVNACPFCQSRSYHVKDLISGGGAPAVAMCCPDYPPDHH